MSSHDHSRGLERDHHFKNIVIVMLFILALGAMLGWHESPKDIDLHYPPSLTDGGVMGIGEVPNYEVYQLTQRVYQNLQYWADDGEKDYPANQQVLKYFFTNKFRRILSDDTKLRLGKTKENSNNTIKNRTRSLAPIGVSPYSEQSVTKISDTSWVVWLDFRVREEFNKHPLKDMVMRFSFVVVLADVNRNYNQWRLQINDYYKDPEIIEDLLI